MERETPGGNEMMIAMLMLIISLVLGIAAMWMNYRQRYELSNILFLMFDIGVIATILLPVVCVNEGELLREVRLSKA